MLAIIIAPPKYILAMHRKSPGGGDFFWLPMWSDPVCAQGVLDRLGPAWMMIICQNPNPATLYALMAGLVKRPTSGYIINPGPHEKRIPVTLGSIN
jgi:hypothetical protein